MKTQIIKWYEGMAVRCLARAREASREIRDNAANHAKKISAVPIKPCCKDKNFSINIAKGEWDDFQRAIGSVIRKKHK